MIDSKTSLRAASMVCALVLGAGAGAQSPASAPEQVASAPPPQTNCKPEYPMAALRAGAQGVSGLAFHVDGAGKVTAVDIVSSSGRTREHRLLDQEAARALSRCPFKGAKDENGQPVDSVVVVHYAWRLE